MVNNLTQGAIESRLRAVNFTRNVDLERLAGYLELLIKWNKKTNLTALSVDELSDEAIDRLIVEPVVASSQVPMASLSGIDLGSGGGSPAIPLAIQLPLLRMKMVESRSRKCAFLREAIRTVALRDGSVEETRFELLTAQPSLKNSADIITVRAVRIDEGLVELIRFLLVPGGTVYRFASVTESEVPAGLSVNSTFPLVGSLSSLLQIISLAR